MLRAGGVYFRIGIESIGLLKLAPLVEYLSDDEPSGPAMALKLPNQTISPEVWGRNFDRFNSL